MPALTAGTMAPDFTLPTMGGPEFCLADALVRGPVVLVFFKISCPVCQYALPFFERLHQNYRGTKVTLLGVSQNTKKDTALFQKQYGIAFPIALDDPTHYKVSNAWGLTNVPTAFLVAPGGAIEVSSVGWVRAEIAGLNAKLAEHVKVAPAPVFSPDEQVAEWRPG